MREEHNPSTIAEMILSFSRFIPKASVCMRIKRKWTKNSIIEFSAGEKSDFYINAILKSQVTALRIFRKHQKILQQTSTTEKIVHFCLILMQTPAGLPQTFELGVVLRCLKTFWKCRNRILIINSQMKASSHFAHREKATRLHSQVDTSGHLDLFFVRKVAKTFGCRVLTNLFT